MAEDAFDTVVARQSGVVFRTGLASTSYDSLLSLAWDPIYKSLWECHTDAVCVSDVTWRLAIIPKVNKRNETV